MRVFSGRSHRSSQLTIVGLVTLALVINGPMATGMSMTDTVEPDPVSQTAEPTPEVTAAETDAPEEATTGAEATETDATEEPAPETPPSDADPSEPAPGDGDLAPMVDPVEDNTDDEDPRVDGDLAPMVDPVEDTDESAPAVTEEPPTTNDEPSGGPASGDPSVPVEQFVPGIQVVPGDESATIYWPDFGAGENYVVQFEQADGTWKTVEDDVDPASLSSAEGPVTPVDNQATVEGLKDSKTYTARIVAADTLTEAKSAVADAIDVTPGGGRGMSAFGRVRSADPAPPEATQAFQISGFARSEGNPELLAQCGIDFTLVLDSSGSIGAAGMTNLKLAANAFVESLVDTGSMVSIASFSTTGVVRLQPTALTSANLATIKGSYSGLTSNGRTNWQDGLLKAQSTFPGFTGSRPDLVVVITDGNPNTINRGGGGTSNVTEGSRFAVNPAIVVANEMKLAGVHMFTVAVGRNIGINPIRTITNEFEMTDNGSNFSWAGYTRTDDYAALASTLKQIAVELCAPSVTVTKEAQTPGSAAFTPADGWDFEAGVTINGGGGAWVNPGSDPIPADTLSTKTQTTAKGGAANFQWEPAGNFTSTLRLKETQQTGFTRVAEMECKLKDLVANSEETRNLTVGADGYWQVGTISARQIVTCTAKNELNFASLTVVKDAVPNDPQDFDFTAAVDNAVATPDSRFPANFKLDDDSDGTLSNQQSWDKLSPGTYVITEGSLPTGWTLEDIVLTGRGGSLTKDLDTREATVVLDDNADATVTFKNTLVRTLTLRKAWAANSVAGDQAVLTIAGGVASPVSETSVAPAAVTVSNASVQVRSGAQVTVSESVTGTGSYTPVLECVLAGTSSVVSGSADGTFDMPNQAVVCTFTNTRTQNLVTLRKAWVNGFTGDTAALTITGGVTDPATASSTAPDAVTANNATTQVRSGATVSVAEVLGTSNTGSYDAQWLCAAGEQTVASGTGRDGSFTMPNTPVVCTFTNIRKSHEVKLQKAWINARGGDTAALTIKGGLPESGAPTKTSTATGATGTVLDTTNVANATVQVGDTVTVTEILGASNVGKYSSTLACTAGDVMVKVDDKGNFEMPDAAVICTFTNDRSVVVPTQPTVTAEVCDPNVPGAQLAGSITIPANPDYAYFIDGAATAAGTYPKPAGSYKVSAQLIVTKPASASSLQQLAAQDVYTWTVVVPGSPVCPLLVKEATPGTGQPVVTGQTVGYTITAKNGGDTAVVGETLVDTLPAGAELIQGSITPSSGVYNASARTITWKFDLPAATGTTPATATFTYQVTVTASSGSIVNSVSWVERSLTATTTNPVEPTTVGGIEETPDEPDNVVGGTEDLPKTGADNTVNVAGFGLLAMVLGGLMVAFGRRRRREG